MKEPTPIKPKPFAFEPPKEDTSATIAITPAAVTTQQPVRTERQDVVMASPPGEGGEVAASAAAPAAKRARSDYPPLAAHPCLHQLADLGLGAMDTEGEGNCCFAAFAILLNTAKKGDHTSKSIKLPQTMGLGRRWGSGGLSHSRLQRAVDRELGG